MAPEVHLAVIRDNNGRMGLRACDQAIPAWAPWTLALVSCALHMGWIIIILKAMGTMGPMGWVLVED
jgi:hypothetical protein